MRLPNPVLGSVLVLLAACGDVAPDQRETDPEIVVTTTENTPVADEPGAEPAAAKTADKSGRPVVRFYVWSKT